jgi:leucyl aminopeptidase (aminopeptidase T)
VDRDELLSRYADLALRVGVNLEPGQELHVVGEVAHAPMVRELARRAYDLGARYVDVNYSDQRVRREMIRNAPEEALTWTPPYELRRIEHLAEVKGALVRVAGDPEPDLFADLDPERVGRARALEAAERWRDLVGERRVAWCIIAQPNEGWARSAFGEADVDSTRFASAVPAPTSRSGCLRTPAGRARTSRRPGGAGTCRTCRRRRCSQHRTIVAPRASSPRRGRSFSPTRAY